MEAKAQTEKIRIMKIATHLNQQVNLHKKLHWIPYR